MEGSAISESSSDLDSLRTMAESADPRERQVAVTHLRNQMVTAFEQTFESTQSWVLDRSERLREVACRALVLPKEEIDLDRGRLLIGRAELFLGDPSRSVAWIASHKVLPYLLSLRPRIAPEWIKSWARNPDATVRTDLAAVFAVLAPRFPAMAVDGLSALSADPRPEVREGFGVALREAVTSHPGLEPYLRARFPGRF
jgi:hypothetical protein